MNEVPTIDYANHPAFLPLNAGSHEASSEVDNLVKEIAADYENVRLMENATATARTESFDRDIAPKIDQLVARIAERKLARPKFMEIAEQAIGIARNALREGLIETRPARNYTNCVATLTPQQTGELSSIQDDGFCLFPPNDQLARDVWANTKLERALLRYRRALRPKRHCAIALHPFSAGFTAIKNAVASSGMEDIASAYLGAPVKFYYAALECSHSGQDWYKGCYSDVGIPTAKTAYMHFDADRNMLKGLFYLKEVRSEDGPFSFIPGSHRWHRSTFVTAVQNAFDQIQPHFEREQDGLDYKLGYYRPRFKQAECRQDTLALPTMLRGSTHFGDDLLDGSEASDELLRRERVFTGPAGTLIMFDGSQGVHRGSMAQKGTRWAIQIGLCSRQKTSATEKGPGAIWRRLSYMKASLRETRRFLSNN